ncbi:MAG: CPBP family intramembrane metalloprotease [Methylacidiphilales bacterium]|nr:CPBP family intramembrane metalloprotease [Candidatus Methylacidiphilales bacterium]
MTLFALTLPDAVRAELLSFVEGFFILFVLVSFICVAVYTAKQVRAGRLFASENMPLPLVMRPSAGWFFIVSVLGLIYLQSVLYAILVLVGIAGALAESRRTTREQFGFDRVKPIKALTWGLLVFGAVMLVETPLGEASAWILDTLHVPHPVQQSVETFRQYSQTWTIFWFMLQAVFLFPVIEELFFRGFLLTFLKNYTSTWLAIVLSAGVFAFAHLNLGAVLPLWFLGVVLGVAYEHTGSLLVPMCVHACFNLATGLSLMMDKGNSS